MNRDFQLKLQAYFDGELPAGEVREVEAALAADAEARALLAEWQYMRGALAAFDDGLKVPESREFYWSKTQRAIAQAERPEPTRVPVPWFVAWRRWLVPAGAVAAAAVAALLATVEWAPAPSAEMKSSIADAGAFVYRDYANGTTLVWLSYPAENGSADAGEDDILD